MAKERGPLLFLLWAIQLTVVLLLIQAPWIEHAMTVERGWIVEEFGLEKTGRMEDQAMDRFRHWCIDSGWVKESYVRLLPDRKASQSGMEGLAPGFFAWMKKRIDAAWWIVYEAIFRVVLLQTWQLYLGALGVAAMVDGLVSRAIKRREHGYSSSDRFALARRGILVLFVALLVYLFLPVPISPLAIPIWAGLCSLALGLLAAHTQQRT